MLKLRIILLSLVGIILSILLTVAICLAAIVVAALVLICGVALSLGVLIIPNNILKYVKEGVDNFNE